METSGDPAKGAPGDARWRRVYCWLPLVSGIVVLMFCWSALAAALMVNGGTTCFSSPGLAGVGDHLAFQLHIWDEPGLGAALALAIYAGISLVPFLLLSGCVRLAARGRTTLFLAVLAIVGTVFMALYDAFGFWAAYDDLLHSSFLCGFAFDLVPVGGLVAGAGAVTIGSLSALVAEWRLQPNG